MAFSHDTHSSTPSLFGWVARFFSNLATSLDVAATTNARLVQMERLNALSDAELAKRGLRREDIARYVFRDILYL